MSKIPEKIKQFYKKYKIIFILIVIVTVITLSLVLYNFFFNNDPTKEREKCGSSYCDKVTQKCDDICSPGKPRCIPNSCPPGMFYYCDRGDGSAGCAPLCDQNSALNKCDTDFICIPQNPPTGKTNIIDTNKGTTYCNWMNSGATSDNCKLYNPQDDTGKLYSSCVNQTTDNYGKINDTFDTDSGITCGVLKSDGNNYHTSSAQKKSQRNKDYYIIKQNSDTTSLNKCEKPSKESFTMLKEVNMDKICINTNTNFLTDSGDAGSTPNPTFSDYDYVTGACIVNKKCGTGGYCDKDQTCDDLCSPGNFVCISNSCPPGTYYYCDIGDGTAGCAPSCDFTTEALNKCTDGTFKCVPSKNPDGTVNVIDTDKGTTYCNWMNEGTNVDNCKLYDPQDNGKLYSSCVNQTDNYGKILENHTFMQNNKTITCGIPKGGKNFNTSSVVQKSQRTIPKYNIVTPGSSTVTINNKCGLPDKPSIKESFTILQDSNMDTICTNTNINFLTDSGGVGSAPNPTFCKYDYSSGACWVNKACDDSKYNYSWNEYSYLLDCTPDGKQNPGDNEDCYKIPQFMFPKTCDITKMQTECVAANSSCYGSYNIGFDNFKQACEIDTDGCGVDTSTGTIIPYTLSGTKCIATISGEQKSIDPVTPGCRKSGDIYAWNGSMCYEQLKFNILNGVTVNIISSYGLYGVNTLTLTFDDIPSQDILPFINSSPDSLILFCYKVNSNNSILYDLNNPQIYFDTSEAVKNYNLNLQDKSKVQKGDSIQFNKPGGDRGSIIFRSQNVSDGKNLIQIPSPNSTRYYLGATLTWGTQSSNSLVLSSIDIRDPIKNNNNIFTY
jgi:hypothetical protein